MENKEENKKLMKGINKALKNSNLPVSSKIGLLDVIKTDLIINSGFVIIDGKPLNLID